MPSISIRIPHRLSSRVAKARIARLIDEVDLELDWTWESAACLVATRRGVSGSVSIATSEVSAEIDLSFWLAPLAGKVERELRQRLTAALAG